MNYQEISLLKLFSTVSNILSRLTKQVFKVTILRQVPRIGLLAVILLNLLLLFTKGFAQESELNVESKEEALRKYYNQLIDTPPEDHFTRYGIHRNLYYIYINDNTDSAIYHMQMGQQEALASGAPAPVAYSYADLGNSYIRKGDFESAFSALNTAKELAISSSNEPILALTNFHFGVAYLELSLPEMAKPLLEFANESFINPRNKWQPMYELTRINLLEGDTSKALENINLLDLLIPEVRNEINVDYLYHYIVLADLYVNVGNVDRAEDITLRVLPYIEKHNRKYYRGIAYFTLSKIFAQKSEFQESIRYGKLALDLFEEQEASSYLIASLGHLSDVYSLTGNSEEAYKYLKEYFTRNRIIFMQHQKAISGRLITQTTETEDAESALQETQDLLRQRQFYIITLIVLLIGIGILTSMVNRSSRSSKSIARKLDHLNKEKDHFIGVVSHDLRSPLNSIMALSNLMAEDSENIDKESLEQYGRIILNSSHRMGHLINNMLDTNKIELGTTALRLRAVSLQDELLNLTDIFEFTAKEKNITTKLDIDKDAPQILGEKNAVIRVIENLVSNAFKFSPVGGAIRISVKDLEKQVQLSVKDSGPGISELDRAKLFKKFEKLSATPTANEQSTGLGLFIVKNLVQEMGGTILVESELGKGTTFKVLFNKA